MYPSVSSSVRCRFLQSFEVQVQQQRISTLMLDHFFYIVRLTEMFDQSTNFKMSFDPPKGFQQLLNLRKCLTLMVSNVSVFILIYLFIACFQSTQLLSFSGSFFFLNIRIQIQFNVGSAFSLWRRFHSAEDVFDMFLVYISVSMLRWWKLRF